MNKAFTKINCSIILIFRISSILVLSMLTLLTCNKENKNRWKVDIKKPAEKVVVTDISQEFYNPKISTAEFSKKYPWFQGSVTDADFEKRRTDSMEIKIYNQAISHLDINKLRAEYESLFAHIQYYFPKFKYPEVFLYSSALQSATDPVFYVPEENYLFVDISGFMGENNEFYKGLETYLTKSMNPQNLIPKSSQILGEEIVRPDPTRLKFIDKLINSGKLMTLQDAFLPDTPDYLKINYSKGQYQWAKENEANIWDYFIENDLVYSDDQRLDERFFSIGPFSKFYTEIDRESSPQIGIFTGWQICKTFFQQNPETKLQDFLQMDATTIFTDSEYKPKN